MIPFYVLLGVVVKLRYAHVCGLTGGGNVGGELQRKNAPHDVCLQNVQRYFVALVGWLVGRRSKNVRA